MTVKSPATSKYRSKHFLINCKYRLRSSSTDIVAVQVSLLGCYCYISIGCLLTPLIGSNFDSVKNGSWLCSTHFNAFTGKEERRR